VVTTEEAVLVARPAAGERPARPGRGLWAVGIAATALAISVAVFDRSALGASLRAARHLRLWWLVLAAAVELASLAAAAEGHRRLLWAFRVRIGLPTVLAIGLAGTAIAFSVPVAPGPFSASYSVRQYVNRGVDLALAGWVLVVLWITASLTLSVLLFAGAALSGSLVAGLAGLVASVGFLAPPVALLLALRFAPVRRRLHALAGWVVDFAGRSRGLIAAILRRGLARHPEPLGAFDAFVARGSRLRASGGVYSLVFGASLANWLLDVACFTLAIHAPGAPVPWNAVLLAYSAGIVAESLWPAPGGLGAVEAAMAAALVAAGVGAGPALAAVLVYRLVSFWMLLAIGWATMGVLARRRH